MSPTDVPLALAKAREPLAVGDRLDLAAASDLSAIPERQFPDLVEGAGFEGLVGTVAAKRWSLPDIVDGTLDVLVIGLNPSPTAADTGVSFAQGTNRFWSAAIKADLVTVDRDPHHALSNHGVGFTDLVKRTTASADQLTAAEYRAGLGRIERLCAWLEPTTCIMIGITGWRYAVNASAEIGWQPVGLGGAAIYVMPSTSGRNAHATEEDLTAHLENVVAEVGGRSTS